MRVTVNGQAHSLPDAATIPQLIDCLQLTGRLAVEVNHSVIPRSRWEQHLLQEGDRVEVVRAVGGG